MKHLFLALSIFILFNDGTMKEFKNADDWFVMRNGFVLTKGHVTERDYVGDSNFVRFIPNYYHGGIETIGTEKPKT